MNKSKVRIAFNGLFILSALAISTFSCNNNKTESTSAIMPADTGYVNTPVDTSALTRPAATDTISNQAQTTTNQPIAGNKTSVAKKNGKASVGKMPVTKSAKPKMGEAGVYEVSEVGPTFPGGQAAAEQYVKQHIEYPQTALDYDKQGTVKVQFTIDENGKVTDAREVGSKLGDGLEDEAIRVVASMPNWTPGTVKGKPVKSSITLPIIFKIEED